MVPGARPQCLRALGVGGGPPRDLIGFACVRDSDRLPVLQVLDAGDAAAPAEGGGGEGALVEEVELSTRCCGNSVVTARLHAVWVNPADVKVYASGEGRSPRDVSAR